MEAGNRGHGRFPRPAAGSQVGFNLSSRHAEREDGETGRLATDLQDIRISSGKEDGGKEQQQQQQHAKVTTEAKSWLAFNYLNKFYFSGHWQEFNFYALFDFAQWHNPQLSSCLKVDLARSPHPKNKISEK